jgi:hypothetical protein
MTIAARLAALAAPLLLSACATVHGVPLPMTTPAVEKPPTFVSTGEIRSSIGKSAAWDEWRIVGPRVNLSRNPDGSWDGTAGPVMSPVHLVAEPGRVSGPGVNLSIERMTDGFVEVGGLFFQDRYWIRVSPEKVNGSTHSGKCSFEFKRVSPNLYGGDLACGREITRVTIELFGTAARFGEPVLPQLAIALVAVMP